MDQKKKTIAHQRMKTQKHDMSDKTSLKHSQQGGFDRIENLRDRFRADINAITDDLVQDIKRTGKRK